jgi:hypothetical protein
MKELDGPDECNNCGCNLYEHCDENKGGKMSSKMLMAQDQDCQLYFESGDGEHVYLEIDNPKYFEVSNLSIKVQIPLDKWNYITKEFEEKYFRHVKNEANSDPRQMELDL